MTELISDPLEAGREAARRLAWREAYEHLSGADANGNLTGEDLANLAEAAYWTGRLEEAIAFRERAVAAYIAEGEPRRAAVLAAMLSIDNLMRGLMAVSSGWLGRAERLLADEEEGAEHGFLAFARAMTAYMMGDLGTTVAEFGRAQDIASRFGDGSVAAMALVFKGALMVASGEVEEGLALLDEATATALTGELQPLATGIVYCVTIDSCQSLGDCGRAAEWTDAANRWCDRTDITGFPGACRIHRAELLRLRGEWPKAEEQALQACEELQGYNGYVTGHGFYEIGEIRRRRGDFAAAEEAYGRASEFGREPQPGLALLRLAQGKAEAAASAIRRELAPGHARPALTLEAPARAGRDLARDGRGSPRARGRRGARRHRRHLRRRRQADVCAPRCRLSRLGPDPAGRAGLGRSLAGTPIRARHVGAGRRAV